MMEILPDYMGILHSLHCFTMLIFGVVLFSQYITGRVPKEEGSRLFPFFAAYAGFQALTLLAGLHVMEGTPFPHLDMVRIIFSGAGYLSLLIFSLALLGCYAQRITIYVCVCISLTLGAALLSGRMFILYPMIFIIVPCNILFAGAMQKIAFDTKDERRKKLFIRLGLLQILYLILQTPLSLRYQPMFQLDAPLQFLIPLFRLLSIVVILGQTSCVYLLTQPDFRFRWNRIRDFALLLILFLSSGFLILRFFAVWGHRQALYINEEKLQMVQNGLTERLTRHKMQLERWSDCAESLFDLYQQLHIHTSEEASRSYGFSPLLLDNKGICTHSLHKEWIGNDFAAQGLLSEQATLEKGEVACVLVQGTTADDTRFFLVQKRITPNTGYMGLLVDYPLFRFREADDEFFLVAPDGKIILDHSGKYVGMRLQNVSSAKMELLDSKGHVIHLKNNRADRKHWRMFLSTPIDSPDFLKDATLILYAESDHAILTYRVGLHVVMLFWVLLLLMICLWNIRREFAKVEAQLKVIRGEFSQRSVIPTLMVNDECIIRDINQPAVDLFGIPENEIIGQPLDRFIRSAETMPFRESVNLSLQQNRPEIMTGFCNIHGIGEKFCVCIHMPAPEYIALGKPLCAFRFMLRHDAVKVDPVIAAAWVSYCRSAADPVFLLSDDGRIFSGNLDEVFGREPEKLEDIFPAETARVFRSMTENVLLSKRVFNFETEITIGSVSRVYDIMFFPVELLSAQHQPPAAVGVIARDISRIRQKEKAVQSLQAQFLPKE